MSLEVLQKADTKTKRQSELRECIFVMWSWYKYICWNFKNRCVSLFYCLCHGLPPESPQTFLSQSVKRLSIVQSSIHLKIPIAVWLQFTNAKLHNPYKLVWFAYCWASGSKAKSVPINLSIVLACDTNQISQKYICHIFLNSRLRKNLHFEKSEILHFTPSLLVESFTNFKG